MRGVASRSGCSTIGVYTHFGDRTGLVEAVLLAAWDGFDETVSGADHLSDPVERLVASALAYREWAVAHPALYPVMFTPGLVDRPAVARRGEASLAAHRERIGAVVASGRFTGVDAEVLAAATWTQVHGWVLAELMGAVPLADAELATSAPEQLEAAVRALLAGFEVPASR